MATTHKEGDLQLSIAEARGRLAWLPDELARRGLSKPDEIAYYFVTGPAGSPLEQVVSPRSRWPISQSCARPLEGDTHGVDQQEATSVPSMDESLMATDLPRLAVPEVRRFLFALACQPPPSVAQVLHWSGRRRRHYARFKQVHIKH